MFISQLEVIYLLNKYININILILIKKILILTNCAHELTGDFDAVLFPLLVFLSVLVAELGSVDLLEGLRSLILDLKLFVILLL